MSVVYFSFKVIKKGKILRGVIFAILERKGTRSP